MKIPGQDHEVEADSVEFQSIQEPFCRYLLPEDGGELIIKNVVVEVFKLREASPDGEPQFIAQCKNVVHYRKPQK